MSRMARRGVLMTASSRRSRPAWLEEDGQEDGGDQDVPGESGSSRRASNNEWKEIEREVREERRRIFAEEEFKSGRRGTVVAYDDVAGDAEEADAPPPGRSRAEAGDGDDSAPEASPRDDGAASPHGDNAGASEAPAAGQASPSSPGEASLPPEGVVTAGQAGRDRKRGGQKKTGAQRRREADERAEGKEGEDGLRKKKRKKKGEGEEEDPDRWVKLRLDGEKKSKRIDATRIVVYHDFDNTGARAHQEAPEPPEAPRQGGDEVGPAPRIEPPRAGNFRAAVRRDLWDDDDDDE